ncbi:hypothetical protein DXG03_009769 [Asterophora parasitica]|uniref:Uncharacterized protein n=1 Tax=Asterophora parasitica TaxID=117018 RepID=A0A9P7FXP1_9AGAR|nr:hypothetical protein DXG03_009769 [Asterophora parasitica]
MAIFPRICAEVDGIDARVRRTTATYAQFSLCTSVDTKDPDEKPDESDDPELEPDDSDSLGTQGGLAHPADSSSPLPAESMPDSDISMMDVDYDNDELNFLDQSTSNHHSRRLRTPPPRTRSLGTPPPHQMTSLSPELNFSPTGSADQRSQFAPSPSSMRLSSESPPALIMRSRGQYIIMSPTSSHTSPSVHSSTPSKKSRIPPPAMKRSTRIPDFAELLMQPGNGGSRLLMVVEIKKLPRSARAHHRYLNDAIDQTEEQAFHAFMSPENEGIETIGAIVAIGKFWAYFEYDRPSVLANAPDQRSFSQQTFVPAPSTSPAPSEPHVAYRIIPEITNYYDDTKQCCCLGTRNSNKALLLVRKRMKELIASY